MLSTKTFDRVAGAMLMHCITVTDRRNLTGNHIDNDKLRCRTEMIKDLTGQTGFMGSPTICSSLHYIV